MTPEERKWADWCLDNHQSFSSNTQEALTHFVAEERERCAKLIDVYAGYVHKSTCEAVLGFTLDTLAKKIREDA